MAVGRRLRAKDTRTGGLARSASSVSIAVFLSRILGLVREQVLAALFGASNQMDAFVVAFRIPNLLRDLFAEGALSSAFVTVFTEYDTKFSREETVRLVSSVLAVLTIIVSLIVILGMIFSKEIVMVMAPDFSEIPGKIELTTTMTRIMCPFLLAISTASVFMGILNARGHFFLPSMASALFNLSSIIIGGALALYLPTIGVEGIIGMAIGTLIGGIAQMAIQLPPLLKELGKDFFTVRPLFDHPGVKKIMKLMVPAIIGLSATQINIFINTNFASQCPPGSVAWLNYSFRLILFPIGVFGVAISIASMPRFARQAASQNMDSLGEALCNSLALALSLTIPASVGLWILGEDIIRLIFERGEFHPFDTLMTTQALRFYAIGLFAYSCVKIIVPVFYALNDTRWPVVTSFLAVAMNIVIVVSTLSTLQHRAIALSTSVTMISNFFILAMVLYRKIGGFPVLPLLKEVAKMAIASLLMGLVVAGLSTLVHTPSSLVGRAAATLGLIGVGGLAYGITGFILKIKALKGLTEKTFRKNVA